MPPSAIARHSGGQVALDEIHRLVNPSELLKIAADHFPETRVLATGSSTLGATAKFSDTLTGRRETVWMTPMIAADLAAFGNEDLSHRLLHGGLPPFFLADEMPSREMQDWIDRSNEIVSAPKVYGFDTGLVSHFRGWDSLRPEDCGDLWGHFVLNEIQGRLQQRTVRYWRNKRGAEVDFVMPRRGAGGPVAIECKWSADSFDPASLRKFRHLYPDGPNYLIASDIDRSFTRRHDAIEVEYMSLEDAIGALSRQPIASS